jgi:hypothetical protein
MVTFVGLVLLTHDWDPKSFVMEGTLYSSGNPQGSIGYDGQFAYYIALHPLRAAAQMDHPAYRYQRILYPFLAWLLSFGGQPGLLPWVMIFINVAAISLASGLLGELLSTHGVPAWFSLTVTLFAGLLIALRADLNEPLAIALALLGLALFDREQWTWAGLSFGLAILAKEIAITFALGLIVWATLNRRLLLAAKLSLASLLPVIVWGLAITLWLGMSPLSAKFASLERIPFYGLAFLGESPAKSFIILWAVIPTFVAAAAGLVKARKIKTSPLLLILLANVGLLAFMPRLAWINVAGALRAAIVLAIVSLLYTAKERPGWIPWIGAYWMLSGLILFPFLIYYH